MFSFLFPDNVYSLIALPVMELNVLNQTEE